MSESGFVISIIARTAPLKHWQIERELRRAIKSFDREKIEMAYPVRVLYHRGASRRRPDGGRDNGGKENDMHFYAILSEAKELRLRSL